MDVALFFGLLSFACVCALAFGCRDHTKRIERLERAVKELNPGLDI